MARVFTRLLTAGTAGAAHRELRVSVRIARAGQRVGRRRAAGGRSLPCLVRGAAYRENRQVILLHSGGEVPHVVDE